MFRRSLFSIFVTLSILGGLSGCMYVAIGALGVVGGYVVSPDTVEGTTAHSLEDTWDAAYEIIGIMGHIVQESPNGSQIMADVGGANITVTLFAINVSNTKINVKARKAFLPKIDIAQDVYTKIVNSLEQ